MGSMGKRERLLGAAGLLFHRQGLEHTSLADIAAVAGVPLGNVYYYFKTRGELVKAIAEQRRETMQALRADWEKLPHARDRLSAYLKYLGTQVEEFTAFGCPAGSLCMEANKQGGDMAWNAALVFRDSLRWLEQQFMGLGFDKAASEEHAARLLGARQGSVLLANTFQDSKYIVQELTRLKKWLEELSPGVQAPKMGATVKGKKDD